MVKGHWFKPGIPRKGQQFRNNPCILRCGPALGLAFQPLLPNSSLIGGYGTAPRDVVKENSEKSAVSTGNAALLAGEVGCAPVAAYNPCMKSLPYEKDGLTCSEP